MPRDFIKDFLKKYLNPNILEKILIFSIHALIKKSGTKVDDEIFRIIFSKDFLHNNSHEKE